MQNKFQLYANFMYILWHYYNPVTLVVSEKYVYFRKYQNLQLNNELILLIKNWCF